MTHLPSLHAFTNDGSAMWTTKSSNEKQCRAEIINYSINI